ncbi:metallophosphoesterase [Bradyrhizobium ganzhouense]|uniref:metallophosphoesterase n=1 Tax=Bradyrhizobium ganzhouense TaxID=1179767 RepID=UPI003CFA35D2
MGLMELTYVIPDLHGRLDLFEKAITAIRAHARSASATVVTLGDYVDRGPSSREIIEQLIHWSDPTLRLTALKGNHEAMMWEACNGLLEPERWLVNGGDATLASYGLSQPTVHGQIIKEHLSWIENLAPIRSDRYRVFVHAGLDAKLPLDRQSERTLLWKRYPPRSQEGFGTRHVVHGHDGTTAAPVVSESRSNLDGLAWKTGRLVVGIYAGDCPGPAVDYLEVIGAPGGES